MQIAQDTVQRYPQCSESYLTRGAVYFTAGQLVPAIIDFEKVTVVLVFAGPSGGDVRVRACGVVRNVRLARRTR